MIAIKRECAELVAIVLAGDRQNRQVDFLELLACRHHRVVVPVGHWMFENTLKIDQWVTHERIERFKGKVFFVGIQEFRAPKLLIAKKILLTGVPAGEREPLDVIGFADVIEGGIIERRMRCGNRHDGGEVRRKFFCCGPLIEAGVRTAPHRHFAVAKWLLREPLDDIVAVARLLGEWLEVAAGIPAAANIDKRKRVTM